MRNINKKDFLGLYVFCSVLYVFEKNFIYKIKNMNNILMEYEHNLVGDTGSELGDKRDKPVVKLSELVRKCEEFWRGEGGYILIIPNSSRDSCERLASQLSARQIGFFIDFRKEFIGEAHQYVVDFRKKNICDDLLEPYFLGK